MTNVSSLTFAVISALTPMDRISVRAMKVISWDLINALAKVSFLLGINN